MKLYGSTTSPYVRNVLIAVAHHGLDDALEFVSLNTEKDRAVLQKKNPLGKIPVLETTDGEVIYDSPVIAEYIDNLGEGESLFLTEDLPPWRVKTLLALSDGVLDAVVARTMMLVRTPRGHQKSQWWMDRWAENVRVGVIAMAETFEEVRAHHSMASISFPVALDYIDFRLPETGWRSDFPALAEWVDEALCTPAFKNTNPRK